MQESAVEVNNTKLYITHDNTDEFSTGTTVAVTEIWSILSYLREQQFNN
jgi:hypothetical protein